VAALSALALVNAASAIAPSFAVLLALRLASGVATAFVGALATVSAAALVPPELRGRAFAVVMGGLTVAFVIGVPLGSAVGGSFGWRATFAFAAAAAAAATLLVLIAVPSIEPAGGPQPELRQVLESGRVLQVLLLTLVAFTATFTVVAYIGPVVTQATGARGGRVGLLQAFIGFGSIAGLATGGYLADKGRARTALLAAFAIMSLTLAAYWWALVAPRHSVPMIVMGSLIFVGATALFATIPVTLGQLSRWAGPSAPVALALNSSLVSLGQGAGALIGGAVTETLGTAALGPAGAMIALLGLAICMRGHGCPEDPAIARQPHS
jgi:DHA1 family inner membrane transport protein